MTAAGADGQAGFTIIEVLVAALVALVGIVATVTVLTSAGNSTVTAQRNQVASREAEHQLEQMRGQCYEALAMAQPHPASGGDPDDPLERITAGGRFEVRPGLDEDMTTELADKEADDGCTDADGDGRVDAAVAPVSTITIGSGSTAVTGKVYRFVSWRDEECPIANLTHLEGTVQDLRTLVTAIAGASGTLTGLVDSNGSLLDLIDDTDAANDTAATASALQRLLYPAIVTLRSTLTPLLSDTLEPLLAQLQPMLSPLQAALAPLASLLDAITERIDLCDLPELLELDSLETLEAALSAAGPAIAALQTPIANLAAIVGPLASMNLAQLLVASSTAVLSLPAAANALTAAVASLTSVLDSVKDDAANGQTRIGTLAGEVRSAIETLLARPHTTHNTKRLTVAVWLDEHLNAGLRKPVWASTIVSDPKDGLL